MAALGVIWADGIWNTAIWNTSIWAQTGTPPDTTPPTLSSPTATATGTTTGSGTVTTNEGGTGYVVVTQSATKPSVAQIQAGQDNTGAAADYSANKAFTIGVNSFNFTGLTVDIPYYAHYQEQDSSGNDSTVVTSSSFTPSAFTQVESSAQSMKYQAFINYTGASGIGYNEAVIAACKQYLSVAEGEINGLQIKWLQTKLSSSEASLPGLQQAAALSLGKTDWEGLDGNDIASLLS